MVTNVLSPDYSRLAEDAMDALSSLDLDPHPHFRLVPPLKLPTLHPRRSTPNPPRTHQTRPQTQQHNPQALKRAAQITANTQDIRTGFNLLLTAATTTQASGRNRIQTTDLEAIAQSIKAQQQD